MVRILSDSTCDLSSELIQKYNIKIIPLHVVMGEKDCKDGVDVTADDLYQWSDAHKTTPKTAAVSPQEAMDAISPLLNEAQEVICFTIGGKMSSTISSMQMAAEELDASDRVFVFDSENLSTGIGLLVIEAAIMAEEGKNAKEIVEHLKELRPLVRSSFVVDTLTYLYRGGRCSGLTAMAGGMLKLHPKISVENGEMKPGKKYRGKIAKVIHEYVLDLEDDLKNARKNRVFITHSGCDQSVIDDVYNYLKELNLFDEILITRAGCVVSSHCGPGTLGVLYIAG